ncbi:MAG: PAS domain S-box protein, partial [Gammaproteobacteria bacterium]|nr:PAS domain S-box protein [Gammaproteobacteria bacterium]
MRKIPPEDSDRPSRVNRRILYLILILILSLILFSVANMADIPEGAIRPAHQATGQSGIIHLYIFNVVTLVISGLCVALAAIFIHLYRKLKEESNARQVALAELEEKERNFRFITENSADVIWTMDIATGKFTYVSPSVYNLRGYTVEEVMAQSREELMTPESAERAFGALTHAMERWSAGERGDTRRVTEVDQPHKDGHLVSTEVVTTLHTNAEGQLTSIIGISQDITERKKS